MWRGINKNFFLLVFGGILAVLIIFPPILTSASRVTELRTKIDDYNAQIKEIEKEIEEYQKEIAQTSKDAETLKNQISIFEATIKKLQANTRLTEKRIETANFILEELSLQIKSKEEEINTSKETLSEIIRKIDEVESRSLLEILLANLNFSDFFGDLQQMEYFQGNISSNLQQIQILKADFENQEKEREREKKELEDLHSQLNDQKNLTEEQKLQKNTLLKETKNKESAYKKLLADRLAKQQALEEEISAMEEQIRIEIDPNSLPKTGSGVLLCPIENSGDPLWCTKSTEVGGGITQFFGNTPFATQNPQVYGGKGHNGIDLRASVGTPIKAAQNGVVVDIGNTDNECRGVSYGKWVLIRHNNNLTTLYAHFSLIKVLPGNSVEAGEIIGYSGDTGYVTGPHLHLSVFATPAIRVDFIKSKICGTTMKMPIAPYNGYLNPLSYL